MDTINRLITEVWLKIFFKYLGRRHPQILITLLLDSNLHNMLKPFLDEDSSLDIDKVQEYLMPEIKKLKTVVIPAGPTRYKLDEADFQKLFAKIKQNATDHQ